LPSTASAVLLEAMDSAPDDEPDVVLEVPQLRVEEISLEVEDLEARVALDASVLELLQLHVGVDARLGRVGLTIKGVEAQVLLRARLDNVARIIDRVLTTIDNNPEIVERLVEQVGTAASQAVGEVGAVTGGALDDVGQAAGTLVDDAGRSVENVAEGLSGKPRSRQPRRRTNAKAARFRPRGERNGDEADAPRR
jgi:hypothetical protein